jgi:hypothetical protein
LLSIIKDIISCQNVGSVHIIHNPSILFTVNYKILKGTTRIVDRDNQPKLAAEVSNLMNTKYRWNEGLIVEIIPD